LVALLFELTVWSIALLGDRVVAWPFIVTVAEVSPLTEAETWPTEAFWSLLAGWFEVALT